MVTKGEQYEILIEDLTNEGMGVGRINNFAVFVEDGVPQDKLLIKITKVKKSYGHARILKIIESSKIRTKPICEYYKKCGGCHLQHINYEAQLRYKTNKVAKCLSKIGGFKDLEVAETIGLEKTIHYRNKAQYPVSEIDNKAVVGFYEKASHRIVPIKKCLIMPELSEKILIKVENFLNENKIKAYDGEAHKGIVRHVLIKAGFETGEIMVCIVINGKELPESDKLIESLLEIENIKCIAINKNREKTSVILGNKTEIIYGGPFIAEYIGDIKFLISVESFFQVNPKGAKILYDTVVEFGNFSKKDVVIDAYSGIGTISLYISKLVKKVYGIEMEEQSIKDACENAKINDVENTEFILGEVEEEIERLYEESEEKIDVIIVDPPRKGCEQSLLDSIIKISPERVIYVSCDPATLARDLKILSTGGYSIKKVQPVDMFAMSFHVETICLMTRVNSD